MTDQQARLIAASILIAGGSIGVSIGDFNQGGAIAGLVALLSGGLLGVLYSLEEQKNKTK